MSMLPFRPLIAGAAAVMMVFLLAEPAHAQTLYWDPNGTGVDSGASNVWNATSGSYWSPNSTNGGSDTTWGNGDAAEFGYSGGTGATVTLTSSITAAGINFNTDPGAFTFAGSGSPTLALGSGGITVAATDGAETFGSTLAIAISGSQSWTNNSASGTLTVNGGITSSAAGGTQTLRVAGAGNTSIGGIISNGSNGGTVALTMSGTGGLILSQAETYTGATTINNGIVELTGSGSLSTGSGITVNGTGVALTTTGYPFGTSPATATPAYNGLLYLNVSGNTLGSQTVALNSGSVLYFSPSGGGTATITNLTLNSGTNELLSAPDGGSNTLAITNLTRNVNLASGLDPVLNFRSQYGTLGPAGNNGTITVANLNGVALANTNGIIGGWAYASSATTPRDFATLVSGVIQVHTPDQASGTSGGTLNSQTLSAASAATNFLANTSGQAVATNLTINSLIEQNDTYINSGAVLTLASGGYIMRSNSFWLQTTSGNAGTLTSGLPSGELFVSTPDAGITDEEIRVSIANNGSTPVTLVKTGQGLLRLNTGAAGYANTYTGGTIIDAGTLQTMAATATLGATSGPLAIDGGTLDLDATSQAVGNFTGTTGFVLNSTASSTSTLAIGTGNGTGGNFQGIIENNSGTGGTVALTKVGTGTITLSGANTYTGATTVNGGTLLLSYASNASVLSSTSALTLGGGTLRLMGNSSGITTQALASLSLTAGTSSDITLNPNLGTSTTLTITSGTLTTGAGSALNFNYSAGTTNGSTVGNDIVAFSTSPTLTNGIIGGGYTVTDSGGTGYATVNGSGQLIRLADPGSAGLPTGTNPSGTGSSTANYCVNSNYSASSTTTDGSLVEALSAGVAANTVTVNTANLASGANLALGGNTLTLTSGGGMLFTGANPYSITATTGGGLTTSAAGSTVFNNQATATVTISAPILNNGANTVTFIGTGTTTLSGTNTYAGATTIGSGATLQIGGAGSLASGTYSAAIADGGLLAFNSSASQTLSGVISGVGSLMVSSGTLTLLSSTNTYSGGTTLNGGTVLVGNGGNEVAAALGTGIVTINSGAVLHMEPGSSTTAFDFAQNFVVNGGTIIGEDGYQHLASNGGSNALYTFAVGTSGATLEATWSSKDVYVDGLLTGSGPITISHGPTTGQSATVHFTNPANTYSGTVTLTNAGSGITLDLDSATALQHATVAPGAGTVLLNNSTGATIAGLSGATGVVEPITTAGTYTLTLGGSGNYSYGGTLVNNTGLLALNMTGSGTQTLGGVNTYTGNTTISASGGTLQIGSAGSLGSGSYAGAIAIGSGGTFEFSSSAAQTLSGAITGSGALLKDTATSTLILTNASNAYTGGTTINAGTLTVAAIADSGTSNIGNSGNLTLGGGTLRYTGSILAATGRNVALTANSTIVVSNSAGTLALTGPVYDNGGGFGLTLGAGSAGTLTLAGTNAYSGPTNVNAGTFNVTGSLGNTAIAVASGATLTGAGNNSTTGAIGGSVNAAGGSTITLSGNSSTPLTIGGNLTLGTTSYTTLNYNLASGSNAEAIDLGPAGTPTGTLTINSGNAYVVPSLTNINGTYVLANFASLAGAGNFTLSNSSVLTSETVGRNSLALSDTGTQEILTINGAPAPTIAYWYGGAGSTVWSDTTSSATKVNWSTDSAGQNDAGNTPGIITDVFLNASSITTIPASTTLGASTTINSLNINGNGIGTNVIAADGSTLTINALADTGSGGTVAIAGNAINLASGANALTVNTPIVMGSSSGGPGANQTWTNASSNTLTIGGNVTGSATSGNTQTLYLVNSGAGSTTISGAISDVAGGGKVAVNVDNTGSGTTYLLGSNSFSGGLTLTAGTLSVSGGTSSSLGGGNVTINGGNLSLQGGALTSLGSGNATINGGVLDLAGRTGFIINNLSGTGGNITSSVAGASPTFTNTTTTSFAGTIDSGVTGGITASGVGSLTLTGTNTYTGPTTITSGTLQIGGGGTAGSIAPSSAIQITGSGGFPATTGLSINLSNAPTISNSIALAGSGDGFINVPGGESATLSGAITSTGAQPEKTGAGTLTINSSGGNSYTQGTAIGGGDLIITTLSQLGAGGLFMNPGTGGAATLEYTGTSGAAPSAWGTALIQGSGATDTIQVDNAGTNLTIGSAITTSNGVPNLVKAGAGTLTLSGSSTYTGNTTISGGTLFITSTGLINPGFTGSSVVTVGNGTAGSATLQVYGWDYGANGSIGDISFSASQFLINGATIIYNGPGTANETTQAGQGHQVGRPFTIGAGGATLDEEGTGLWELNPAGVTSTNIANGLTLTGAGSGAQFDGVLSGNGTLTITGSGTWILTGANTYTGSTTINSASTLQIGNGTTDGNISTSSGITDNGSLIYNLVGSQSYANVIGGSGTLTKTGAGTLTITADNSYTGNVLVSGGTLTTGTGYSGTNTALGAVGSGTAGRTITVSSGATMNWTINNVIAGNSGSLENSAANLPTIILNGGTLTMSNYNAVGNIQLNSGGTLTSNNIVDGGTYAGIQLLGTVTVGGTSPSTISTTAGTANLLDLLGGGTTAFNVSPTGGSGADLTISRVIADGSSDYSGMGSLTKSGAGVMQITAVNTYTGTTTINAGTLAISGSGTLGATTGSLAMAGGTLDLGTTSQTVGAVTITSAAASGNTIQNGSLTGSSFAVSNSSGNAFITANLLGAGASLTMSGGGTVTLSGANTYGGGTSVSTGMLRLSGSGTFGSGGLLTVSGGTADLNGAILSSPASVNGIYNGGSSSGTITSSVGGGALLDNITTGMSYTYSGAMTGSLALTVSSSGTGVQTISGANSYTGGTTVNAGTLRLGGSSALPSGGTLSLSGSGNLDLAGQSPTVSTLTGSGGMIASSGGSSTLTVSGGGSFSGTINDNFGSGGGPVALVASGGTLTLSGSSSYSGGTQATGGTLRVANLASTSATGSGPVAVSSGATLAGTGGTVNPGFIGGSVNITGGGTIAPAGGGTAFADSIGSLTVGALTLNNGTSASQLSYQFVNSLQLDSIGVTGAVTLPTSTAANEIQFNFFSPSSTNPLVLPVGGPYALMTFGSLTNTFNPAVLSVNPADLSGTQAEFSMSGNAIDLTIITANGSALWQSDGNSTAGNSANWFDNSANWTGHAVPSGAGLTATFDDGKRMASSVTVAVGTNTGSDTVGSLVFNSATTEYTLNGGTLILNNNGSGPNITVSTSLEQEINTPLVLADGNSKTTTFTISGGSYLDVFGTISEATYTGQNILLTGGGTLQLDNAANSYTGGTTVSGATLLLDPASGPATPLGSGALAINGASSIVNVNPTNTGVTVTVGGLSASGGGTLNVAPSTTLTVNQTGTGVFAGTLSLSAAGSGGGLMVGSGTVQLNVASATTLGTGVTATVASGATLQLTGTVSALSDPSSGNLANILTQGTGSASDGKLSVIGATTQTVGVISGQTVSSSPTTYSGNTTVGDGTNAANLTATQILQNTLTINAGSTVTIAPSGSGIPGDEVAATSAAVSGVALAAGSSESDSDSSSDPFTAIQAAISSGSISAAKGQQLENRIAAIERLSATDPGLDVSLLEDRVLAALPSTSVWSSSGTSPLVDSGSGLLAVDSGTFASSSATTSSSAAAFAPAADFGGTPAAVPEPSTLLLAVFGGVGVMIAIRRRTMYRD